MTKLSSRTASGLIALALATAGASVVFVATAAPAAALCRYGSPNCVNPRPNFDYQMEEEVSLDSVSDGWQDPDCKFYGNCLSDNQEDEDQARCRFNNNCEEEARGVTSNRVRSLNNSSATASAFQRR